MKLFGKDLFTRSVMSDTMYDFAQHGLIRSDDFGGSFNVAVGYVGIDVEPDKKKKTDKPAEKPKINPKELHKLGSLNIPDLKINCDPVYLEREIETLEKKVKLLFSPQPKKTNNNSYPTITIGDNTSGAVKYGRLEVESLILRMKNRLKYATYEDRFNEWPYTSSEAIQKVIDAHSNLRFKLAKEFVPDFPREAIDTMEAYTELTQELCGQKPVFYVVADKKDFGEISRKRDPILLAQSPFGLFWQVLGAWDEEMVLLDEL